MNGILTELYPSFFIGGIGSSDDIVKRGIGLVIVPGEEASMLSCPGTEIFTVDLSERGILSTDSMEATVERAVKALDKGVSVAVISGTGSSRASYISVCVLNALGIEDPFHHIYKTDNRAFDCGFQYDMASYFISAHQPERKGDEKTRKLLREADDWGEKGAEAREKLKKRYLKGKNRNIIESCHTVRYRNVERVWDERSREWEEYVSSEDTLEVCPWERWLKEEIASDDDPESLERRCFRGKKEAEMAVRRLVSLGYGNDELFITMMHRGICEYFYLEKLVSPESRFTAASWPYQTEREEWVRSKGIEMLYGNDGLMMKVAEKGIWGLNTVYGQRVRLLWYAALSVKDPENRRALASFIRKRSEVKNGVSYSEDYDYVRSTGVGDYVYRLSDLLDETLGMSPDELDKLREAVKEGRGDPVSGLYGFKDLLKETEIPRWSH